MFVFGVRLVWGEKWIDWYLGSGFAGVGLGVCHVWNQKVPNGCVCCIGCQMWEPVDQSGAYVSCLCVALMRGSYVWCLCVVWAARWGKPWTEAVLMCGAYVWYGLPDGGKHVLLLMCSVGCQMNSADSKRISAYCSERIALNPKP